MNVAADAPAQLLGGGLGKGHHQQLFDVNRPDKGGIAAEPEQQPQVERGDGVGFSGARRGFNQALANQRQAQGI